MSLHLSPDTPAILRAVATGALSLHVAAASVALVAGGASIVVRKGGAVHRAAGNVFFGSMLATTAMAAIVALIAPERIVVLNALLATYLTATGWRTARGRPGAVGPIDTGAFVVGLSLTVGFAVLAWIGTMSPKGLVDGLPYQMALVFGAVTGLGAATDLSVIRRGGVSGAPRLRRHIWRMSVALFMGSASFFMGQQRVMPEFIRGSPVLFILGLAPLGAMIFWLVRTRSRRPPKAGRRGRRRLTIAAAGREA